MIILKIKRSPDQRGALGQDAEDITFTMEHHGFNADGVSICTEIHDITFLGVRGFPGSPCKGDGTNNYVLGCSDRQRVASRNLGIQERTQQEVSTMAQRKKEERLHLYRSLSQHWTIFPDTGNGMGGARLAIRRDNLVVSWSTDSVPVVVEDLLLSELPSWTVHFPTTPPCARSFIGHGFADQLVQAPTFLDALAKVDTLWPMAPGYRELVNHQEVLNKKLSEKREVAERNTRFAEELTTAVVTSGAHRDLQAVKESGLFPDLKIPPAAEEQEKEGQPALQGTEAPTQDNNG